MPKLDALDLKAFVPARDFEMAQHFYQNLGFTLFDPTRVLSRISSKASN